MPDFIVPQHEPRLVLLSVVIACVASYAALYLAGHVAHASARIRWLMAGATAMGIGIWSMHFIAMLAYRLPLNVAYDVPLVALSLAIAVVASALGLGVAQQTNPRRARIALTGPTMGLAIAGMHYTGMAAMRLPARPHYDPRIVVLSVVIAIAASYAAILLFLRFRNDCSRRGAWLKGASAIVMGHAVAGMHYTAMAAVHFDHAPMVAGRPMLPPAALAGIIAIATVVLLGLVVGGAMLDRWAGTLMRVRRNEERFRVMVDALHDYAIFTVDASGVVDSWNRGAERLLGRTAEETLGRHLSVLYDDDESQDAARELQLAAQNERHESNRRVSRHDGVRNVNIITSAMRDGQGQLLGFVRILRDITDRLRAEEELARREHSLRQAQKMEAIGQLAGGVAHDFNNMLTAIRGYAHLLRDEHAANVDAVAGFDEIIKAVDRSAGLTRQLLAFSRKQVLQPRPVNLTETVRDMESMLGRLMVGDIELVTQLAEDAGQIVVDPAQLQQVVLNLVINARDAMPDGGVVVIRTENVDADADFCASHPGMVPGPQVMLSVTDTGVGMAPEVLAHIFEPFFTTKQLGRGTGLGLSTVYGIVKQSGGYVNVKSQPGRGSTFEVYFRRTRVRSADQAATVPSTTRARRAATVLLVDDEESVRRMLTKVLERSGYLVLAAEDGAQALAMSDAHAGDIDLLVTDMMMPRMNGRELSRAFHERRPDARVLFMSGYADNDIIDRGWLDARMTFIQKPFELSELLEKIRLTLQAGRSVSRSSVA